MRILLIAGEFPPYMFGGGGTFMYNLSRGLANSGLDVTVISMKFWRGFSRKFEVEEHGSRLRVFRVPIPAYLYPRHQVFQVVARPLIHELIKDHDIVHMNTGLYYPFLRDAIRESKLPTIVTNHGDPIVVYKTSLNLTHSPTEVIYGLLHMSESHMAMNKELEELYTVFVSRSLYETIKTKYKIHRYSIIYNGLDFAYIDKVVSSSPKTSYYKIIKKMKSYGYRIMVYNARLYPIKNHLALIKILWFLLKRYDIKVLLVLTNDGITKNSIIKLINKLDISGNVLLTGKLPYDETLRILNLADVVPYVSLYEAHPLALVEALYLGKPIIAFNLPYAREIFGLCCLTSNVCSIKLTDDIRKFTEELYSILLNKESSNPKMSLEQFSLSNMTENYIRLYENLLSMRQ